MDRYYNEEQAKELDKFIGFEPNSEFFFVPEPFKKVLPKEKWPVFKLRGLDGRIVAQIESSLGYLDKDGHYFVNGGNARIMKLKHCVRGWKNFRDKNGDEIEFFLNSDELPDELIARIRPDLQKAIEDAIDKGSNLSAEELTSLKF